MAVLGMQYELPPEAINVLDIKHAKLHDARTTPTG